MTSSSSTDERTFVTYDEYLEWVHGESSEPAGREWAPESPDSIASRLLEGALDGIR